MKPILTAMIRSAVLGGLILTTSCAKPPEPVAVTIEKRADRYTLMRDGKPFFIKGAGAEDHLEELAEAGANSVRTWGHGQTAAMIDKAHKLGITVLAGIWITHERHGFDYGDEEAFAAQLAEHKATVDAFKDHPALLMWGVGNEVSIDATHEGVWKMIEAVSAYIKEVDPYHPIMTVLPHVSTHEVEMIRKHCPSIDLLGFNVYGGIGTIGQDARDRGWEGPYVIAEWGTNGNWEVSKTPWGAEIEPTTTEKAMEIALRYARIQEDPHCLGAYVFFWGQKQETTATWFNLFLHTDAALESVDVLQYLWAGSFPKERAPALTPLRLNGKDAFNAVTVAPGETLKAEFTLWRGDEKDDTIWWELLPESQTKGVGGDPEGRPKPVDIQIDKAHPTWIAFQAPAKPGPYRLFAFVQNAAGRAAAANIPFLVEGEE